VPYASHRFAELAYVFRPMPQSRLTFCRVFEHFYFRHGAFIESSSIASLEAFAEHGHILFGADFPLHVVGRRHLHRNLDAYEMTPAEKAAINRGNALALFERLHG